MNKILREEIEKLIDSKIELFRQIDHSTICITGATGLIGSWFIYACTIYNQKYHGNIQVIAMVRDKEKAKRLFEEIVKDSIVYIEQDVRAPIQYAENIDYIIHGASVTASKAFVQYPIETIQTTIEGTGNLLEFLQKKHIKSMVYLSSLEVYGQYGESERRISEDDFGTMSPIVVRNSYPESKRMAECICAAYVKERQVPIKIARLTQTFGPGIDYHDNRVFAEFARCAIEGKDIVLHTKGETIRNYCYISDAVAGILYVLLRGVNGEAYNIAGDNTKCSIYEMACETANLSGKNIQVCIKNDITQEMGYNPIMKVTLDTTKLKNLGWKPDYAMQGILCKTIQYMSEVGKANGDSKEYR